MKTVLNDKLFDAGLTKGQLDEKLSASDAIAVDEKHTSSKDCKEEVASSKKEDKGWSLLGLNSSNNKENKKSKKCEGKKDSKDPILAMKK